MAKNPDNPKKPGKTPTSKAPSSKTPNSKASRPDVQPIGPALAELLNPAINRGESGLGSSTGLQPPPDNSWDRRSGGEAAAHRARASTKSPEGKSPERLPPDPLPDRNMARNVKAARHSPLRPNPQPPGARVTRPGFEEAPQANYGTAATIPTLDPELAKQ